MDAFSQIEISPVKLGKMAKAISEGVGVDQNAICLLLQICSVFVQGWHNEVIDTLNSLRVKDRRLAPIEITPRIGIIDRKYYKHLANIENSFKKVLASFDHGELNNVLDENKIRDIRGIRDNLVYLGKAALDQKEEWHQKSNKNKSSGPEAYVTNDWENELTTISRRISTVGLRLEGALGCKQEQTSGLFGEYREQRRFRWYIPWRK
jgi:hypothetical protein